MKRVAYVLTSPAHRRVFESLVEREDMKQVIIGPEPIVTSNLVPEDYRDFGIKDIRLFRYNDKNSLAKIVNNFKPDVYVQSDLSNLHRYKKPTVKHTVMVHHGAVGNHAVDIAKKLGSDISVWKGFSLYCGANHEFARWSSCIAKASKDQIVINAVPQFDLLNNSQYVNSFRQRVIAKSKFPEAKKVLLFVGFCCKDRIDFNAHNRDYFRAVIELERLARKNDWLVMIKPRHTHTAMINFLKGHRWGKKYIKDYSNLQKSKYLHFITTTGHIYRYFFADTIVVNGSTTVELEACATNSPLVVVRTEVGSQDYFDPYNTIDSGAGIEVTNMSDLENAILNSNKIKNDVRKNLLNQHGIVVDGKMHVRLQNAILRM